MKALFQLTHHCHSFTLNRVYGFGVFPCSTCNYRIEYIVSMQTCF